MSIEERLQRTRVTADWLGLAPWDSRLVEALDQLAKAEMHVEAANRALDAASAALERPAATEPLDGGENVLREPRTVRDRPMRGEVGIR